MDTSVFPEHERTRRILNKVADPLRRLEQAHTTAVDARKQVVGVPKRPGHPADRGEPSELTVMRNEALMVLHRKYNWSKAKCARLLDVDRRVVEQSSSVSAELMELSEEEAKQRALELHAEWLDWGSIWRTSTEIRDELVRMLATDGDSRGRIYTNAEIAAASGMSTPLVAQIRRGSANDWKRKNREQYRETRRAKGRRRKQEVLDRKAKADTAA